VFIEQAAGDEALLSTLEQKVQYLNDTALMQDLEF